MTHPNDPLSNRNGSDSGLIINLGDWVHQELIGTAD